MSEIATRLRKAREGAGYSSATAAVKAFGWTYPTYAGHENGSRGPKRDEIVGYAKAFGVSVEWLLTGRGPQQRKASEVEIAGEAYLPVPVYDIRAAAGAGALVEDGQPTSHQVFRENFLRRLTKTAPDNLSVIQVSGDSMWETLHDGDAVLVDRSVNRIVKDGIYILQLEDELLVKRCSRDLEDGSVIVQSDNPRYATQRVKKADRLAVLGRVIWMSRALG